MVKLNKFKSMEKNMNYKTMRSIFPKNCHFVMKNQYCQKHCHFQNVFLPKIRQILVMVSVKHLTTLLLLTTVSQL